MNEKECMVVTQEGLGLEEAATMKDTAMVKFYS
jgi:hypothetical protein